MKIRSITVFDGSLRLGEEDLSRAARLAQIVRKQLTGAGFHVQTTRLALAPHAGPPLNSFAGQCAAFERRAGDAGLDYISLGPLEDGPLAVEVLAATRHVFTSMTIAPPGGAVNVAAAALAARTISQIASLDASGYANLRFAALANCGPGIPFFPAAYAAKNEFSFALAIEAGDLALCAAREAYNLTDAIARLIRAIEASDARIQDALKNLDDFDRFSGCDWSMAPHPDPECSIGAALELLSGAPFGQPGTLTAVRAITRAIRAANVRHVGFSGVFLPLLEDYTLAERCGPGLNLQTLLAYSAVCGAGLDTIPLAGDTSEAALAAILADVATLAVTLDKPLTARFMPVPGTSADTLTAFDNPFLVNARTLSLTGEAPALFR